MKRKIAFWLALAFYCSTLPAWPAGPIVKDLIVKESPWVDVRAYGAVPDPGDESTDSATAIDNAVNAAGDAGGGTVFIPDGTYILGTVSARSGSINSYIVPRDNVTIRLAPHATLKVKAGQNPGTEWNIIHTSALLQNFKVIGGTIDGGSNTMGLSDEARSNTFIGATGGGYRVHIYDVTLKNMTGHNPVAFSGSSGTRGEITIERCRFLEGGSALSGHVNTDFSAVYLLGTSNKVIDNHFENASFGDNTTTAWEDHGISFEAYGNYVNNYRIPFYLTSESGAKRVTKIHDNIFDNVWTGGNFAAGQNNGFGKVDYYNNTVITRAGSAAGGTVYTLYGPDQTTDTADEWNVYNNSFDGSGEALRLISAIGVKFFRFHHNLAKNYASYGYLQSTGTTFDSTYANYLVDIQGNTFYNFTASQPITDINGGTVKWLDIQGNKFLSDAAVAITAIYLRTTANGGTFKGNYIDNTYTTDIDFGSGMANVFVDHHLRNAFNRAANYAALGSQVYDGVNSGRTFQKIATDNTWRAVSTGTAAPNALTWAVGDIVYNTANDNVLGWKCSVAGTPGTWKYMQVTLEP